MAHLAMRTSADGDASASPLTPARLLSAPLADLLAEVDAEVTEAPADYDAAFEGVAVKPHAGRIQIVLPKARSAAHRDVMARVLVGRLLGTELAPLPASLQARSFGGVR